MVDSLMPAMPTPEQKQRMERREAFHSALGRFVAMFAKAEFAAHILLRRYARMSVPAARALLSGVRADETKNRLQRLLEIGFIGEAVWNDLKPTLDQLNEINHRRNLILHHSTVAIEEEEGMVTNADMAHIEERIIGFKISPRILDDMTSDLRKIILHIHTKHVIDLPMEDPEVDAVLRVPWRYTLKPSPLALPQKAARPDRTKKPTRQGPPKPPRD